MGWVVAVVGFVGCAEEETQPTEEAAAFTFENTGNAGREGHTPRGFMGQGAGIFVGDNLNSGFPEGDGVQLFISFNLTRAVGGDDLLESGAMVVESAELAAGVEPQIEGTPFADLGSLIAEEVVHSGFSSELWDLEPLMGAGSCTFASDPDGPFACDFTDAVQNAVDEGRRFLDVRMSFETAGDSDGMQDMVFFFVDDVNATDSGLFTLDVTAR